MNMKRWSIILESIIAKKKEERREKMREEMREICTHSAGTVRETRQRGTHIHTDGWKIRTHTDKRRVIARQKRRKEEPDGRGVNQA